MAFTNDEEPYRMIAVIVVYDEETGGLKVHSYSCYKGLRELAYLMEDAENLVKSTGYEATFHSGDLAIKNATTGNMADKTKEFTYYLDLMTGMAGSEYIVTIYHKDGTVKRVDTLVLDENGCAHYEFTLADGEYARIPGIAAGTMYMVYAEPENYEQTMQDVEGYEDMTADLIMQDTKTSFTHTLTGMIPTGVFLTIAPFAVAALAGAAGIFWKSRKIQTYNRF